MVGAVTPFAPDAFCVSAAAGAASAAIATANVAAAPFFKTDNGPDSIKGIRLSYRQRGPLAPTGNLRHSYDKVNPKMPKQRDKLLKYGGNTAIVSQMWQSAAYADD